MEMLRPSRIESFLEIADVLARRSTCIRRGVGAVLVDKYHHIIGTGYNGVPRGIDHCISKPCGGHNHPSGEGLEDCLAIHAEQNALMQCPDVMEIDTLYVTTSPCMHCIKMLLNTNCRVIVFRDEYSKQALDLWASFGRQYHHVVKSDLGTKI